jgi:hypothetical protein
MYPDRNFDFEYTLSSGRADIIVDQTYVLELKPDSWMSGSNYQKAIDQVKGYIQSLQDKQRVETGFATARAGSLSDVDPHLQQLSVNVMDVRLGNDVRIVGSAVYFNDPNGTTGLIFYMHHSSLYLFGETYYWGQRKK